MGASIINKIKNKRKKRNISQMITIVFLVIILLGAILLCLPISSRDGKGAGFLTALFTSTSATCVTGLSLGDTWTQWSPFGQGVLLVLIQLGGLGFMSIASLFFFALKRRIDFEQLMLMADSAGVENLHDAVRIQRKIIFGGLAIEGIGAAILTCRFLKWYSFPKSLWLGIFHSVSAFCNAGFDVLGFEKEGGSLQVFQTDVTICLTLAMLIILGGIGFVVWDDITSKKRHHRWSGYTKIVVGATLLLLLGGTLLFWLAERNNPGTLGNMTGPQQALAAFFQSATTRTAGFAAVDQGALTETGKILTIFFMFIGGASGSTAGGMKVATFCVLCAFLVSRIKGRNSVHMINRKIPENQIMDALSLFSLMTLLSYFGTIIISATSNHVFLDGLFESVSALATVGLSTGITGELGVMGEVLLIIYMFLGRIGILRISIGFLQSRKKQQDYEYPEISMPIG